MTTETRESIDPRSDFAIGAVARMAARWVRASHTTEISVDARRNMAEERAAAVLMAGWCAQLLLSFVLPWDEALDANQRVMEEIWTENAQAADYLDEQMEQIVALAEGKAPGLGLD